MHFYYHYRQDVSSAKVFSDAGVFSKGKNISRVDFMKGISIQALDDLSSEEQRMLRIIFIARESFSYWGLDPHLQPVFCEPLPCEVVTDDNSGRESVMSAL